MFGGEHSLVLSAAPLVAVTMPDVLVKIGIVAGGWSVLVVEAKIE